MLPGRLNQMIGFHVMESLLYVLLVLLLLLIGNAAVQIIISTTDNDGETYTFDKVTVNDVIRIGAADGSNAEYKVTGIIQGGMYTVEHLRSAGVATDELEYAFTFLSAFDPEGSSYY